MPVAFATRGLGADVTPERILERAQALDVRLVLLSHPLARAAEAYARLRAGGVRVCAVAVAEPADAPGFVQALERAARCAAAVKAGAVLVAGGRCAGGREAAADQLVRTLHASLAQGVPLAVRNSEQDDGLLGFEEVEWLRSELPRLGLWFDPTHAMRLHAADAGPSLRTWLDAYAGRVDGVFVQGPDAVWDRLAKALPAAVPWVLDLAPDLGAGDMTDAVRWLRSLRR